MASHEKETLGRRWYRTRNAAANALMARRLRLRRKNILKRHAGALSLPLREGLSRPEANQNFLALQSRMVQCRGNKLAAGAALLSTNAVSEYNAAIESFPAVLFCPLDSVSPAREYFDFGEDSGTHCRHAPEFKF